jgi:hypothetical protein
VVICQASKDIEHCCMYDKAEKDTRIKYDPLSSCLDTIAGTSRQNLVDENQRKKLSFTG